MKWQKGMCENRGVSAKGQGRPGKQVCPFCGAEIVLEKVGEGRVFTPPHHRPAERGST